MNSTESDNVIIAKINAETIRYVELLYIHLYINIINSILLITIIISCIYVYEHFLHEKTTKSHSKV